MVVRPVRGSTLLSNGHVGFRLQRYRGLCFSGGHAEGAQCPPADIWTVHVVDRRRPTPRPAHNRRVLCMCGLTWLATIGNLLAHLRESNCLD